MVSYSRKLRRARSHMYEFMLATTRRVKDGEAQGGALLENSYFLAPLLVNLAKINSWARLLTTCIPRPMPKFPKT